MRAATTIRTSTQTAHMAQRVIHAAETAGFDSLSRELGNAERFATQEEERLELLAAITHEMRATLAVAGGSTSDMREALGPHLQLLRHLSQSRMAIQ